MREIVEQADEGLLVQLVRLISSPSHPLVLVLDDLQWADQPTLDFLTALLDEEDLDGILLAGLYRREELENSPALRRLVEKATATPGRTTCLHLDNLGLHGLMALLGEMLGSPLANVFRTQADVLRIRRSQRAETIAGEAGVKMLLPAVLVMAATVLIIVGPFFLNYLEFGLGLSQ